MPTSTLPTGSFAPAPGVGPMLREWRDRRRLSQLDLSTRAGVSTRHLSYVETGRATPSRELILHLARQLEVPLREQNRFLLAAGYAPVYSEFDLTDDAMRPVVDALGAILAGSEPNPTLVMDRHWNLVMANDAAFALIDGVPDELLVPPLNVLRLSVHPEAMARRIVNFDEVAEHLVVRVRRQIEMTGDAVLADLLDEVSEFLPATTFERAAAHGETPVAIPMRVRRDGVEHSYLSVVSTFGTAVDVNASELTIETFYEV
ncbi:MAG: helix-turn-helix domain-containing protein [Ilumatobacteraceae bacterium]